MPATPNKECPRCLGSGEVAVRCAFPMTEVGAGPVPDDARGITGIKCPGCDGAGVTEADPKCLLALAEEARGRALEEAARLCDDYERDGDYRRVHPSETADEIAARISVTDGSGSLNPPWVEWLMGSRSGGPTAHTARDGG